MDYVISIIGFGNIGKYISGLLLSNKDHRFQINIIDVDWKVYGGILDFEHAGEIFPQHHISYNSQELFQKSDFIFHCAGASVPPGKSRLSTCQASIEITEAVFHKFSPVKDPKIIVVANPVEIIAYLTHKITGLSASHVVGTGTYLDSIRMNYMLRKTNVDISQANAILLGEHGTTTFLSEQLSTVNGQDLAFFFSKDTIEELMNAVKAAAAEIKKTQKATIYGVSFCAVKIFESLLGEQPSNYPVSTYIPDHLSKILGNSKMYLSLYAQIDKVGALPIASYLPNQVELKALKKSIALIKPCIPKKYR